MCRRERIVPFLSENYILPYVPPECSLSTDLSKYWCTTNNYITFIYTRLLRMIFRERERDEKYNSEKLNSSIFFRCTQIKTYSWDNAQVILVGNKCDMEDERVISFERGKQLADSLGLEFFETSAKENINVRVSSKKYI